MASPAPAPDTDSAANAASATPAVPADDATNAAHAANAGSVRLNKFLASRLGLSRREADTAIAAGRVTVDGATPVLGARVDKSSKVCYNESIVPFSADFLYLAFHKPVGYVCSRRAQGSASTIYELLPPAYRHLKTVGRLDKDSSGLILLTNDGDFAFSMTHPRFRKTKVYEVELNKPLEPLHQQMISDFGVALDDGISKFTVIRDDSNDSEVAVHSSRTFHDQRGASERSAPRNDRPLGRRRAPLDGRAQACPRRIVPQPRYQVVLHEGRNRQIRRTFAALGYRVTKLHRVQFGKYELGNLEPGAYCLISQK